MKRLIALPLACLSFATLQAQSWNLAGNAGTNPSTQFVGTTDNQPLRFRINNTRAGLLHIENSFFGWSSGLNHTTGFGNTGIGVEALKTNTTSNYNSAFGWRSLWSNTSGYNNTATGGAAMIMNTTGNHNTATGYYSLGDNTTGNFNSGFGLQALGFSGTGNHNTAVGAFAAGSNTYGNSNVAVGAYSMYWSRHRSNIVAIGDSALYWNGYPFPSAPTGLQAIGNTATGSKALYNNTMGYLNTAFGFKALFSSTTGNSNTAVGYNALYSNTTGSSNTAVGYNAYPVSGTVNNYTGIGYNVGTSASTSNSVEIGNSSVTWIGGQVGWSTYSDERIKDNISDDVQGLAFITKLRPVTYTLNIHRQKGMTQRNNQKEEIDWPGKFDIEKKKISGFLAQQVEEAAKASNYDFHGVTKPGSADGLYSLSYGDFVVPLVKAVQEQQSVIEKLQKKIEELEKKIAACLPANY